MAVIILEGCDKTGKSTLAKELQERHGYKVIKCSNPKGDPYVEYVTKLLGEDNVIFDRFLYGELVYGPIYRRKSQLNANQVQNLELLLRSRDAVVVYCHAGVDFIKRKFTEENEDFAKAEHVERILSGYEDVLSRSTLRVIRRAIPTSDRLPEFTSVETPKVLVESRYIGDLNPEILFVGERNNVREKDRYKEVNLPFDFGRSSTILKSLIQEVGIKSFGITNAYKNHLAVSGEEQLNLLSSEVDTLNPRKVVALGSKAAHSLKSAGVKAVEMWHPSYLGRFKSAQLEDFIVKLKEVCEL